MARAVALTIIEMIVVISMMLLLLSFLFPATFSVQRFIKSYQCRHNLERIYEYIERLAYENPQFMGDLSSLSQVLRGNGEGLKSYLLQHFPEDSDTIHKIFMCPSDPRHRDIVQNYGSYDYRLGIQGQENHTGMGGKNLFFISEGADVIIVGDYRAGWHGQDHAEHPLMNVLYANGETEEVTEEEWQNNLKREIKES